MISHKYRCIYVKVPKCGSSTVRDYFAAYHGAADIINPHWCGGLLSKRMSRATRILNLYPEYFTFTFVRNPFQRFVSLYLHAARLREHRSRTLGYPPGCGGIGEFAELCAELLDLGPMWGEEAQKFFAENRDREFGPRKTRLRYLGFELCHMVRQVDFIPDFNPDTLFGVARANGNPHSFIGRVETFERDFRRVLQTLGAPERPLMRSNFSGTVDETERARHYSSYYDRATRRLVERLYAEDFERLGYDFEDKGMTAVPPPFPVPPLPREPRFSGRGRFRIYFLRLRFSAMASVISLLERNGIPRFARTVSYIWPIVALRRRLS